MVKKKKVTFELDMELWQKLSIKAIKEGKTKTEILKKLIINYVKG